MMTTKRMSSRLLTRALIFAFLLSLAAPVSSSLQPQRLGRKKPYALIFGTVFGPDARPLSNVKIKIRRSTDKKAKWELISDRRGEFAQRVPAGTADYLISAKPHPKVAQNKEVKLHIENDERQDITVHLIK